MSFQLNMGPHDFRDICTMPDQLYAAILFLWFETNPHFAMNLTCFMDENTIPVFNNDND